MRSLHEAVNNVSFNIFGLYLDRLVHRRSRVQHPAVCCASGCSCCFFLLKRTVFSCSVEGEKKNLNSKTTLCNMALTIMLIPKTGIVFLFFVFIALNHRCLKPLLGTKWLWMCWLPLSEWPRTEAHWLVGRPVGRTGHFCYGHSSWLKCRYSVGAT